MQCKEELNFFYTVDIFSSNTCYNDVIFLFPLQCTHVSCGAISQLPFGLVLFLPCPLQAWFFIISWFRLLSWAQRGSHCLWILRTPGVPLDSLYGTLLLSTQTFPPRCCQWLNFQFRIKLSYFINCHPSCKVQDDK